MKKLTIIPPQHEQSFKKIELGYVPLGTRFWLDCGEDIRMERLDVTIPHWAKWDQIPYIVEHDGIKTAHSDRLVWVNTIVLEKIGTFAICDVIELDETKYMIIGREGAQLVRALNITQGCITQFHYDTMVSSGGSIKDV